MLHAARAETKHHQCNMANSVPKISAITSKLVKKKNEKRSCRSRLYPGYAPKEWYFIKWAIPLYKHAPPLRNTNYVLGGAGGGGGGVLILN